MTTAVAKRKEDKPQRQIDLDREHARKVFSEIEDAKKDTYNSQWYLASLLMKVHDEGLYVYYNDCETFRDACEKHILLDYNYSIKLARTYSILKNRGVKAKQLDGASTVLLYSVKGKITSKNVDRIIEDAKVLGLEKFGRKWGVLKDHKMLSANPEKSEEDGDPEVILPRSGKIQEELNVVLAWESDEIAKFFQLACERSSGLLTAKHILRLAEGLDGEDLTRVSEGIAAIFERRIAQKDSE